MTNSTQADFIFTAIKGDIKRNFFLTEKSLQEYIDYYTSNGWQVNANVK